MSQASFDARRRLERSGLPLCYLDAAVDLDQLDTGDGREPVLAAARRFADGELRGLLLTGAVGVGKSTIAAAAAKRYLQRASLRWVDVVDLCLRLTTDGPLRTAAFETLAEHEGALVLDDIDKTRPSAFAAEVVLSAINNAVSNLRPLVVTANPQIDQLAAHWPPPFGEAIGSRLVGYCMRVDMAGRDRRTS
jgi:DNA replication protein DnaC